MKKILLLFMSLHSLIYTVNYFDARIGYTGSVGIQGQITDEILFINNYDYRSINDPKNYVWDGVRFYRDSGGELSLDNNLNYSRDFTDRHWQNILFDETSTGVRRDVELNSKSLLNGTSPRELKTQNLILRDTDLIIRGASKLFFSDLTRNSLTLENSSLYSFNGKFVVDSRSEFDLISKTGNNSLIDLKDQILPKVNLEIQSGSELNFSNSGDITFGRAPILIGSRANANIDNGTLKLTYSNLKFVSNPDEFVFKNNSILQLDGSQTRLELTHSTFKDSEIILGSNTEFKGKELKLENSNLNIYSLANMTLQKMIVDGTSQLDGEVFTGTFLDAKILQLNTSSTFNTENIFQVKTGVIFMEGSNNTLNINNNIFDVETGFAVENGTINVKSDAFLRLKGNYQTKNMKLKLNIDSGGEFLLTKDAQFYLNNRSGTDNDYSTITNSGLITVYGSLKGSGTILGTGDLYIKNGASLIPEYRIGSRIANLKVNNSLIFDGGSYFSDVDLDSNNDELSDKVIYVDKDVNISNGLNIETVYSGTPGRDAMDFQDKKFTIIQSDTASSAGDIIGDYTNISVVNSPNLPALLDFEVSDEQTNGNKDITLVGKVQGVQTLATHSKVGKNVNAKQVVSILPPSTQTPPGGGTPPVLSPGAQKLQNAMLTMTNAQVSQNLNSLHAEPYSSHLTIGLEQNDLFLNMVMDHAAPKGDVYHSKSEMSSREVVPETKNNIWVDTAYVSGDVDGEDGLGSFSYRLTNVVVGGDIYEKDYLTLGLYGGYGSHKMNEHDSVTQEFETDTYHIGTYGSYRYNDWVFTGMFGYSYGKNETERDVTVGTSSGTSEAKFDSHSFYTGVRAAYPIKLNRNTTLTPNAGMSYSYIYQEEVKESGFEMADLAVDSADADSFITSVGLHLEYEDAVGNIPIRPMTFVRYEHDWSANSDSSHTVDAAFRHSPDDKTSFSGQNRGENLILVGAGIEVEVTSSLVVGVGFTYSDDSNGREKGAGVNFEYLW